MTRVAYLKRELRSVLADDATCYDADRRHLSLDEREAVKERKRAQQFLDVAAVLVVALDVDGNVTLINKKGCELLGYPEDQILGENWFRSFLPERDRERVRAVFDRIVHGQLKAVEYYENRILSRDRGELYIEWHNAWLRDEEGAIIGALSSGVDATEKKRLTEKLIEQASLAKLGELSAIVAHEVKNPLAGIIGAARMLEHRMPEGSTEREIAGELVSRANDLNEGVKDILAYARPTSPNTQRTPVKILLEDVVSFLSNDERFADVQIKVSGEETFVSGDPEMLKPVFLNLLVNAAQAMDGRGVVSVSVEAGSPRSTIVVHDNGPGIAAADIGKIFEPFFTTKGGGTGLGLPIAKRAIELHGGEISVYCAPEGGTKVVIRLPVRREQGLEEE